MTMVNRSAAGQNLLIRLDILVTSFSIEILLQMPGRGQATVDDLIGSTVSRAPSSSVSTLGNVAISRVTGKMGSNWQSPGLEAILPGYGCSVAWTPKTGLTRPVFGHPNQLVDERA